MTDDELTSLAHELWAAGIRWRTYVNPQRSDGLFVAENKPIEPYPGVRGLHGEYIYPVTPYTVHSLGYQLPHIDAARLVDLLNGDRRPVVRRRITGNGEL